MFYNYFLITDFKALLNKQYLNNTLRTPALCSHVFENTKNDEYVISTLSSSSESTPMALHKKTHNHEQILIIPARFKLAIAESELSRTKQPLRMSCVILLRGSI
jgi:outer membrane lipopolysaccharide assembly protein LptE/RlpB